jgi:hypothetical protein
MDYIIEAGKIYFFLKESVWVRAIKAMNEDFWHVQRVKDNKCLLVPTWALTTEAEVDDDGNGRPLDYWGGLEPCEEEEPSE